MKTRLLHRIPKGFTLIEVMTVITIIGMLAALGFGGFRIVQDKAKKKNTVARLQGLQLAIESYKLDNGEYPEALSAEDTTTVKDAQWKVGGARLLYQVATGDGNSAIKGGGVASVGEPGSTGKIYWEEVTPPTQKEIEAKKPKSMVDVGEDGTYYIIDGWRKPFQYIKALKDRNKRISNIDLVHSNADYEIWSYGKLEQPLDDEVSMKEWIASWGTE